MNNNSIEELVEKKIYELANFVLSKFIKPNIKIDKVAEIDEKFIDILINEHNIEAIILDIDETVRKNMNSIPKCNEEWIDMIKSKLKVIVVSNGIDGKIEEFMKSRDIQYIGFAHKPLKKNFKKACEMLEVNPEKVLVIGDSIWADIYGGKRNNMKTAMVKDVKDEER